jgi:DNA mismatch endonuclease (patch repair protein)
MSRNRSRDTKPELLLRRALWAAGLRYRTRTGVRGKPDVVFTRARVAVFVDGCFWHACPQHYCEPLSNAEYWKRKIERNRERDAAVTSALEADGWTVLRFWEHEVMTDLVVVVGKVTARVR